MSDRAPLTTSAEQEFRDRLLADDREDDATVEGNALRRAHAEIDALRAALDAAAEESVRWHGEAERQREIVAGREEAIHAHAAWDESAVCAARSEDDVRCMWPASEAGDDGEPLCRDCAAERVPS